jgi:hypothetical protein
VSGDPGPRELIRELEAEGSPVLPLAEVLSLAAHVEPHLIRRARIELVPEAGSDAEADLWFGPLVSSRSVRGIVLDTEAADLLRERLVERGAECAGRARRLVQEAHGDEPLTVHLLEDVLWMCSGGARDEQAVEGWLDSVLRAMLEQPQRALDLAYWAVRTLPVMPATARTSESAWRLWLAATSRLPAAPARADDPPAALLADLLESVLPEDPELVEVGVRLNTECLELGAVESEHTVTFPRASPVVVGVRAGGLDETLYATLEPGGTAQVALGQLRLQSEFPVILGKDAPVVQVQGAASGPVVCATADGHVHAHGSAGAARRLWRGPGTAFAILPRADVAVANGRSVRIQSGGYTHTEFDLPDEIVALAAAPPGTTLAAGHPNGDVTTSRLNGRGLGLLRGRGDAVADLAFSPDGRTLAAASDAGVAIYDMDSLRLTEMLPLEGARAVAFDPARGEQLVVARAADVSTWWIGPRRQELHRRWPIGATDVDWHPKEPKVIATCVDGTTRQWHTATGEQLAVFYDGSPRRTVRYTPDGSGWWSGGGAEHMEITGPLGTWEVEAIDADEQRRTLRFELAPLLELTQAIALDFHVMAQADPGASRTSETEDPSEAYGSGRVLPAEQFEAVRHAAEWALNSVGRQITGEARPADEWTSWLERLVEAGVPNFESGQTLARAVGALFAWSGALLEHAARRWGPDTYASQYTVSHAALEAARRAGIAVEVDGITAHEGDMNVLVGTFAEVVKAYREAGALIVDGLMRWEELPREAIDGEVVAPP